MNDTDEKENLLKVFHETIDAVNRKDVDALYEFEKESFGYGYRTSGFRNVRTYERYKNSMDNFFASMKDYSMTVDLDDIRVIGDVGFVSCYYTEKITEKDDTVRYVKARGTFTYMKIDGKWKEFLYHRDAQFNNQ